MEIYIDVLEVKPGTFMEIRNSFKEHSSSNALLESMNKKQIFFPFIIHCILLESIITLISNAIDLITINI